MTQRHFGRNYCTKQITTLAVSCNRQQADAYRANLALICAAPALLAALQATVSVIENAAHDYPNDLWLGAEYQEAIAAIAQAVGERKE